MILCAALVGMAMKVVLALSTYGTNDMLYFEQFLRETQYPGSLPYQHIWHLVYPPFCLTVVAGIGLLGDHTGLPFVVAFKGVGILADLGSVGLVYQLMRRHHGTDHSDPGIIESRVSIPEVPRSGLLGYSPVPSGHARLGREGFRYDVQEDREQEGGDRRSAPQDRKPAGGVVSDDGGYQQARDVVPALWVMAISPVSILVTGFHGQIDPIMMVLLLGSVYLVSTHPSWAGVSMGLALGIKIMPAIFLPAIVMFLPAPADKVKFLVFTAMTWVATNLDRLIYDPVFIMKRLMAHRSIYGHWGLSRLIGDWYVYYLLSMVLLFVAIVAMTIWLEKVKAPLFLQCGVLMFLWLTLTPGFGVQYLVWGVPWVVALGFVPSVLYAVVPGVFIYSIYAYWSGGTWLLADSDVVGEWGGNLIAWETLAWVVVAYLLYRGVRKRAGGGDRLMLKSTP